MFSKRWKLLRELGVQRDTKNSKPWHPILCDAHLSAEPLGIWILRCNGNVHDHFLTASQYFQRNALTDRMTVDVNLQLPCIFHDFAVERQYDIAFLQSGAIRGSSRQNVPQDNPPFVREIQPLGKFWRDSLRIYTQCAASNLPVGLKLSEYVSSNVAGGRKADSFTAAGLRQNHGVDPDNAAI